MNKFIVLLLIIIPTSCSLKHDSNVNDDPNLLSITETIQNYSNDTILKKINDEPDYLSKLLKIVSILLDKNLGISTSNIDPNDFMKLSFISRQHAIGQGSILLYMLPNTNRETIRVLHNKYMLQDASCIFFSPTADDVIKYKFAFGCTHYARAFISIVKSLHIVQNPKNMRYAISCNSIDYNNYLVSDDKNNFTINGHQFVIIKIKNKWYAINTNRLNDYTVLPDTFSPDMNIYKKNYPITFKAIEDKTFLLRKIGKDYDDNCNDNSFCKLMNIYISGNHLSNDANWKKYED